MYMQREREGERGREGGICVDVIFTTRVDCFNLKIRSLFRQKGLFSSKTRSTPWPFVAPRVCPNWRPFCWRACE